MLKDSDVRKMFNQDAELGEDMLGIALGKSSSIRDRDPTTS